MVSCKIRTKAWKEGFFFGKYETLTPTNKTQKGDCLSSSQEARKETCWELHRVGRKGSLQNAWHGSPDKNDLIWKVLLKPKLWEVHLTSVASMPSQIWEQPNMRQTGLVCFVNATNEWIYHWNVWRHQRNWTFMIPIYFFGWCSLYVYRIGWFFVMHADQTIIFPYGSVSRQGFPQNTQQK